MSGDETDYLLLEMWKQLTYENRYRALRNSWRKLSEAARFSETQRFLIWEMIDLGPIPKHEHLTTSNVEQGTDVLCSFHGGGYAIRLVGPVRADAGENVATVGGIVAQVSAQS